MNTLFFLALLVAQPATEAESRFVERIIDDCPTASRGFIDPFDVLALLRLENDFGVPANARGILPAWACLEAGFRSDAVGDRGAAVGVMQLHESWLSVLVTGRPGQRVMVDWRRDIYASAVALIVGIERQMKAARQCRDPWRVAEAIVARPPHRLDCAAETAHWKLASRWRHGND